MVAGLVAACNAPSMTATAPLTGIRPEAATLSILDVAGPSAEQGQRFSAVLAQEARSRGFVIAETNAPIASSKLRAYLDVFAGPNGQPAISYVLQTSADGRNRAARVSGIVPASSGAGWTGFDDAAMRRVASQSLDALARQLTGQPGAGGDVAQGGEPEAL
jgi:hypothetical protein